MGETGFPSEFGETEIDERVVATNIHFVIIRGKQRIRAHCVFEKNRRAPQCYERASKI